jgi:hypothetical protein
VNRHLEGLLREVGITDAGDEEFWRRVLVLRATGPFPDPSDGPEALAWHGFHLMLLDRNGRPSDRIKCRAPFDAGFERECRLMEVLGRDQRLRGVVPRTWTAHSERVRVHRTRHIEGANLEPVRSPDDMGRWTREAVEILEVARRVTEVAEERFPELLRGDGPVDLAVELNPAFETLESRGLEKGVLRSLRTSLSEAVLPRRLQFGDLWPGNILRGPEGWTLIDLERVGFVQIPLYDAFHLIWSSGTIGRSGGLEPLLALIGPQDPGSLAMEPGSPVLEACQAEGISPESVPSALVAFAIELTAYRCRPGMPEPAWRPFLRDLEWLSGWRWTDRTG